MIVRRGKDYTGSVWENEVALSTGLTPTGRPRRYIALIPYPAFKSLGGPQLKPGEVREVEMVEGLELPRGEQRFCRGERG